MTITDGTNKWTLDLDTFRVVELGPGKVEISGTHSQGKCVPMGDVLAGKGPYSHWKSTISPDRHTVNIELDGLWYYNFWYTGVATDPGSFTISGYCDARPPIRS